MKKSTKLIGSLFWNNKDETFQQLIINGVNITIYKSGSKIHIKKKNRGKFTDYCGGKVTDACIRRAKASGNPTLVKRATFADNARHFKHRLGGQIVQEFKWRKMLNKLIM